MMIVKFSNGNYGIREWSWYHLTYVFMTKNMNDMQPKNHTSMQEFKSFEDASCACNQCIRHKTKESDMGKPVINARSIICE
jgi:hypothetical protein